MAAMARLVEAAAAAVSPMESMVMRFARIYTPVVLVAAACVAFIPWAAGRSDHKVNLPPSLPPSLPPFVNAALSSGESTSLIPSLRWKWRLGIHSGLMCIWQGMKAQAVV